MYISHTHTDNICAISSPVGIGGVALIRVSGVKSLQIVDKVFSKNIIEAKGYTAHFGSIIDEKQIIDEVIVTVFKAPKSYTGENSVEISCHGSTFIQHKIIELLVKKGARIANPGEFSQRAFLNGKMDLSQTEAVADLIHAKSNAAHEIAIHQMKGGFSSELKILREKLIEFASLVELELDFAEEDVEFADRNQLNTLVANLTNHIGNLKSSFKYGNAIKNGVQTVIAGRPNAGKSTLLNKLLKEERAIVSNQPGTTRDTIEEIIIINGIEFRLIDTAGVRNADDKVEILGVERTFQKIATSSIFIYIYDVSNTSIKEVENDLIKLNKTNIPTIVIANKIDLLDVQKDIPKYHLKLSAKKEENIGALTNAIYDLFIQQGDSFEGTIITNLRHYEALENAQKSLKKVNIGLEQKISGDLLAMDIRDVLHHIGSITGDISSDELLGNIFANFCIGK